MELAYIHSSTTMIPVRLSPLFLSITLFPLLISPSNLPIACSDHTSSVYNEYCQTQIFGIDEGGSSAYSGSSVFMYGLNTVGATSMIDWLGSSIAAQSANTNVFVSSVIRFVTRTPGT